MNKKDIILISVILGISLILLLVLKKDNNYAYVYYNNKLIKEIDLNKDNNYTVDGYNGKVKIVVKNKQLKVDEESSPLHLCSLQGFSNTSPIVCLPNKIVIEFNNNELDTIVR